MWDTHYSENERKHLTLCIPSPRLMYSSICMYTCLRIREEKFTRGRNRDIGRWTHRGEGEKENILRKNVKLHSSPQKTLPVAGARFFSQPDSHILQTVYFPSMLAINTSFCQAHDNEFVQCGMSLTFTGVPPLTLCPVGLSNLVNNDANCLCVVVLQRIASG